MSAANTIAGQSVSRFLVFVLSRPALLGRGLKLLWVVWTDFFWPQYRTRLWRPPGRVVSVQHELDDNVPFNPASLKEYMGFVHLWMRTRAYLYRADQENGAFPNNSSGSKIFPDGGSASGQTGSTLGKGVDDKAYLQSPAGSTAGDAEASLCDFLDEMILLYRETGNLYKVLQSTTPRPSVVKHPSFWWLYLVDPHYHCLPSLHVIIVCYNFLKIPPPKTEKARREWDYAYHQALRITETVLEVKQHSLNCVAASLFYLTARPGGMKREQAEAFAGQLYQTHSRPGMEPIRGAISISVADSIREAILERYRVWLSQWEANPHLSPTDILLDYLGERGRDE